MTDHQRVILNMMKWFHNFCENHNLQYYLIGGTMLGAVRHQGFIPWDDDADVGMPRKDYEIFLELTKEISSPYCVESPKNCKSDYLWPFAKVYDPKTTLIENTKVRCVRGVWMDVFPIDGTLNGSKRIVKYIVMRGVIKSLILKGIPIESNKKLWKRVVLKLSQPILDRISTRKLIKLIDHIGAEPDFSKSEYIADIVWGGDWACHTRKYIWGTPKLYRFEDTSFFGVSEADKYLSQVYGNYLELPPIEKRVNHNVLYVDLNHGWCSEETQKYLTNLTKD